MQDSWEATSEPSCSFAMKSNTTQKSPWFGQQKEKKTRKNSAIIFSRPQTVPPDKAHGSHIHLELEQLWQGRCCTNSSMKLLSFWLSFASNAITSSLTSQFYEDLSTQFPSVLENKPFQVRVGCGVKSTEHRFKLKYLKPRAIAR